MKLPVKSQRVGYDCFPLDMIERTAFDKFVTAYLPSPLLDNMIRVYCLEDRREYYQNCCVLDCVTQCSQCAAHLYEQFLQVQQIGFVTLGPLRCVEAVA